MPIPIPSILNPSETDHSTTGRVAFAFTQPGGNQTTDDFAYYDTIAKEYELSKRLFYRSVVEAHSFFNVLGDVNGLRVLDLACGNGHYTRAIYERGARQVDGLDLSNEMINLAIEKEQGLPEPRNLQYHVADVATMPIVNSGNWDVVTAVFLFCYASTVPELKRYLQSVYDNIAPGGRLVSVNDMESNESTAWGLRTRKYGYVKTALTSTNNGGRDGLHNMKDGDSFQIEFFNPGNDPFSIINYYHSRETYETLCHQIGFKSVRWVPIEVSNEGYERMKHVPGYWEDLLNNPPFVIMEATK